MVNSVAISLFSLTILILQFKSYQSLTKTDTSCFLSNLTQYSGVHCFNRHHKHVNANDYGKLQEGIICTLVCPNNIHTWTRCSRGKWTDIQNDCKGNPARLEKKRTKISRKRRGWFWSWGSTSTEVVYREVVKIDQPPNVICPTIPNKWQAAAGKTKVAVSWPDATATDPEDGTVPVHRETNLASNSEFSQGSHSVIYSATDSRGNKGICIFSFEVEVITCTPVDWPRNGIKNCDTSGDIYGSTCTFQCNDGYELNGNPTVTCQQNKQYSGNAPTCDRIRCSAPAQPTNGITYCADSQYYYQTVCMTRCNTGYNTRQFLLSICRADKTWSSPLPDCYDSEPPRFSYCPETQTVYTDWAVSYATVTWLNPEATDNANGIIKLTQTKGQPSGSMFPIGVHKIRYHATDEEGNQSPDCTFFVIVQELFCTQRFQDNFLLYSCPNNKFTYGASCTLSCIAPYPLVGNSTIVCDKDDSSYPTVGVWKHESNTEPFCRQNSCPALTPPLNGALACDTVGINKFCQMLCNAAYDIPRTAQATDYYVCGDSGTWSRTSVPDCTAARRPNMMLLPGEIYYFAGDCNDNAVIEQIKQNFVQLMEKLTNIGWTGICPSTGCTASSVEVTCGARSGKKKKDTYNIAVLSNEELDEHNIQKRQTHQIIVTFNINMDWISTNLSATDEFNHNDAEIIKFFNDIIQPLVSSGNLTVENYTATSAVYGWTAMVCPTGQVPRYTTVTCAGCPIGTFYNSTRDDCQNCTVGTYQDEEFQMSCKACPSGTMTEREGSKNITQCIDICGPGYYSYTGYEPCFPCPIGYYQQGEMSTTCVRCNDSHVTTTLASNSSSQCLDYEVLLKEPTSQSTLPALSSAISSFSLSFLINMQTSMDSIPMIKISNMNGDNSSFSFDNTLHIVLHGVSVDTGLYINRTFWTHISIIWDSTIGQLKIYKKGDLVYTQTLASLQSIPINNGSSMVFMSSSGTKAGWKIDGLIFKGAVLSPSEIDTLSKTCSPKHPSTIYTMEDFRLASATKIELISPSLCNVVDHCDPNPCGQFTCIDRLTGYTCECNDGYTGINCESPPDYCANNTCQNGATCEAGTNNYTCLCVPGYLGYFCDHQIVNGSWSSWGLWSSDCSSSCDVYVRNRTRFCDNPPPDPDGAPCDGSNYHEEVCPCQACPSFSTVKEAGNEYNCSTKEGYVICVVTCLAGLTFGSEFENFTYTCGQNTSYEWNTKPPKCLTQESPERVGLMIRGKYTSFKCSLEEEAKQNLANKIIHDNDIQCVKNNTCSVNVTLSGCNTTADTTDVIASIELYKDLEGGDTLDLVSKFENNAETAGYTALKQTLEELKVSHTQVDMTVPSAIFAITVGGNNYITSTYDVTKEKICQPGTVPFQSVCVECPSGTYQKTFECEFCNQGSYQTAAKQTSCILCPVGYTTLFTGSTSSNDCIESNDTTTISTTLRLASQQTNTARESFPIHPLTNHHGKPVSTTTFTTASYSSGASTKTGSKSALIGMITGSIVAFLALCFISGILFRHIRKKMRMRSRNERTNSVASLNMIRPGTAASVSSIHFDPKSFENYALPPVGHFGGNLLKDDNPFRNASIVARNDIMVKEFQ